MRGPLLVMIRVLSCLDCDPGAGVKVVLVVTLLWAILRATVAHEFWGAAGGGEDGWPGFGSPEGHLGPSGGGGRWRGTP